MSERPVYDLIPPQWDPEGVLGYVMEPTDRKLSEIQGTMESLYNWLDPDLCPLEALDYMGFVLGIPVWDKGWTEAQKRAVYRVSNKARLIRGTLESAQLFLKAIGITYGLWVPGRSSLPMVLPSPLGTGEFQLYIGLGIENPAGSQAFKECLRVVRAFLPAGIQADVGHYKLYLGISKLPHKMFETDYPVFPG